MNTLDNQIKNFSFPGYIAPPIGFGSRKIPVKQIYYCSCGKLIDNPYECEDCESKADLQIGQELEDR